VALRKILFYFIEKGKKYIELKDKATKVIKIEINHISGKARRGKAE